MAFHHRRDHHNSNRRCWLDLLPQSSPRQQEDMVVNRLGTSSREEKDGVRWSSGQAALVKSKGSSYRQKLAHVDVAICIRYLEQRWLAAPDGILAEELQR